MCQIQNREDFPSADNDGPAEQSINALPAIKVADPEGKSGGKLKAVSSWSAACKSDLELQPHFIHLAFLAFSTFWSNAKGEITIL